MKTTRRAAQATTPGPRAITAAQQMRALRYDPAAPRLVRNCGDEEIREQVSGIVYIIPPRGTVKIPARLVHPRNEETNKILLNAPPVLPTSLKGAGGGTPNLIVAQLLEKAAARGLTEVKNDGADDDRFAEARRAYMGFRRERALRAQNEWMKTQEEHMKDRSAIPLVMPQRIKQEITWLRQHGAEAAREEFARYIAFDGGFSHDDIEKVIEYLEQYHPERYAAEGEALIIDRDRTANPQAPEEEPEEAPAEVVDFTPGVEELDDVPGTEEIDPEPPAAPAAPARQPARARAGAQALAAPKAISDRKLMFLRGKAEELGIELEAEEWQEIEQGDRVTVAMLMDEIERAQAR